MIHVCINTIELKYDDIFFEPEICKTTSLHLTDWTFNLHCWAFEGLPEKLIEGEGHYDHET